MTASKKIFYPKIGKDVFIHPSATVHGRVTLRDHVSIWPGTVLRGDLNQITIGKYTNIQDLSVVHVETDLDCRIGEYCVVGHQVIAHACRIGNGVLIGMGAIILNGARVGDGALIGAGALVTENTRVKAGSLYLGAPARFKRRLTKREMRYTIKSAKKYAESAREHVAGQYAPAR
jgi:carbonic anhydrase/acetyltransferase-like protein (isoleucine patch superfamily)